YNFSMNRLAEERSPYLLQHASNPVDWFPWGPDAFEKARSEDKPIFLSIGYSTCHWCHVMAHESFESQEIADILNKDFVSIKVDREERPDVDRVYMTFVQATTGSGGWPMSVWLTPDLKPFYGGTYFPPDARWGRPGFPDILREIVRAWRQERTKVEISASNLTEQIRGLRAVAPGGDVPPADALKEGVAQFAQTFDQARGGFGDAPKFPRPSELLFLLRETARTGDYAPAFMVAKTLQAMSLGGMRDHVGGGFHRYSVDGNWRVPHFEKMLYDQAQITLASLEAFQLANDRFFADVAEDTLEYVLREMTNGDGGFFSAEDADSVPPEDAANPHAHKTEGAFYVWTQTELEALLKDDFDVFKHRFGIRPDGNAPADPQGEFTGRNLLYVASSIDEVVTRTGMSSAEVEASLQRSRMALFQARLSRPRPHLDDKVLAGWNGLMLVAFSRAARVLPGENARARYLEAAERSATFLEEHMWDGGRQVLKRRYRDGDAAIDGYAEDYACLIFGLLELFQASGNPHWLAWARALQKRQDELFWDAENGGWFNTTGADPSVILRMKEDYDGAEPSPSSISVLNLLVLAHLTGEAELFERIDRTLKMFGPRIGQVARAVPMMMAALSTYHAKVAQVVVVGPPGDAGTRDLMRELASKYDPFAVIVPVAPGARQTELARMLPFVSAMEMRDGRATAYVCHDFTCTDPATDAAGLAERLSRTI
ncbi:MAG TPA: thioredoxin domain-containing protein, partial [Vicinamibacterales bacterium]|nr:thioredoxin domain-containing protein [Vicinamibacterales bacterium]